MKQVTLFERVSLPVSEVKILKRFMSLLIGLKLNMMVGIFLQLKNQKKIVESGKQKVVLMFQVIREHSMKVKFLSKHFKNLVFELLVNCVIESGWVGNQTKQLEESKPMRENRANLQNTS